MVRDGGGGGGGGGDNIIVSCLTLRIYVLKDFNKRLEVTEVNNCQLDDTNC